MQKMMVYDDLTDNEWALVEALFHMSRIPNERRGRPRVDARGVVNGVLWALASGGGWATLSARFPSPPTCRRRFEEWLADGTIAELLRRLRTSGRDVPLRGPIGAAVVKKKPVVPAIQERRSGAFWTTPESLRAPVAAD
jgi:putative transposase